MMTILHRFKKCFTHLFFLTDSVGTIELPTLWSIWTLLFEYNIRTPKYNILLYKYIIYYFISIYIYFDTHLHLHKFIVSHTISYIAFIKYFQSIWTRSRGGTESSPSFSPLDCHDYFIKTRILLEII